jgi:hypothetical protein
MLTLSIKGLSAVVYRADRNLYEILLNPKMEHIATLSALTKFLDPLNTPGRPWKPDVLSYVPIFNPNGGLDKHEQIALWHLAGRRLTFRDGTGGQDRWANRDEMIDFAHYHSGSTTDSAPGNWPVVEISQGHPSSEAAHPFTLQIGLEDPKTRRCATEVRWVNLQPTVQSGREMIQFKNDSTLNIAAVISNVAPEPDYDQAVEHFDHYYELVKRGGNPIPWNEKVKVVPKREQMVETYDCVPPGAMP